MVKKETFKPNVYCQDCGIELFSLRKYKKAVKRCGDCDYKRIHDKLKLEKELNKEILGGY